MNHLVVFPILLPALTAAILLLLGRHTAVSRLISVTSTAILLLIAIALLITANTDVYQIYALGDWQAPFGIAMVLDRLSALLILVTAIVAMAAVVYASLGWDTRGKYFHALFQFQLMGLNGAFLTGDLFNLFVFFEVLLIASYCLLLHGLGQKRLRAAVHYVAINLTGSAVFLIAVSLLYSVTGTLNMAHLAERVAAAPQADIALIRAAGLMLLGVFAVKAALFPLYFWLPSAYSNASAPVAALFAVMTKVGVYAIVRVCTLIFGVDAGTQILGGALILPWLLPVALITLGLAAFGALSAKRLSELIAYLTVASVGTMLAAFAAGGQAGLNGALFYMIHSTLIVSAMFLLAELIGRSRGDQIDSLVSGPALWQPVLLGVSFLLGGAILAGLPLSSGFIAKLMILRSVADAPAVAWIWAVILTASLLTLIGLARAGSIMIWNTTSGPVQPAGLSPTTQSTEASKTTLATQATQPLLPVSLLQMTPFIGLVACSLLMVVFATPLQNYTKATAKQLSSPAAYIQAAIGSTADRAPRAMSQQGQP